VTGDASDVSDAAAGAGVLSGCGDPAGVLATAAGLSDFASGASEQPAKKERPTVTGTLSNRKMPVDVNALREIVISVLLK